VNVLSQLQLPTWLGGALVATAALFNLITAMFNYFLRRRLSPEVQAAVDTARESARGLAEAARMLNARFRDSQKHNDRLVEEIQELRSEMKGLFGGKV
jgi:hypothetical protein